MAGRKERKDGQTAAPVVFVANSVTFTVVVFVAFVINITVIEGPRDRATLLVGIVSIVIVCLCEVGRGMSPQNVFGVSSRGPGTGGGFGTAVDMAGASPGSQHRGEHGVEWLSSP
jgi:hypothetical protein